eukprot:tig00020960_g16599.t1
MPTPATRARGRPRQHDTQEPRGRIPPLTWLSVTRARRSQASGGTRSKRPKTRRRRRRPRADRRPRARPGPGPAPGPAPANITLANYQATQKLLTELTAAIGGPAAVEA